MQNDSKKPENECAGWYALKVFYNRTEQVREQIKGLAQEIYIPRRIISSLMFVYTTPSNLEYIRKDRYQSLKVYTQPGERKPFLIPEREMEVFKFVTGMEDKKMTLIDPDAVNYKTGQRVRVTGGIFEGAEGYIKRIKGDKRLIVSIEGVVAVATSYIPSIYLENLENDA
ncbi:MAG: transcriptional regulator [Bacteroidales bacterium]|nr:transcriptional regulator [Bacteroidales bacterium]